MINPFLSVRNQKYRNSLLFLVWLACTFGLASTGLRCLAVDQQTSTRPQPAQINADDMAVLQESKPLVTRAGAWQSWGDHIHLRSGQEKLPLVLSIVNGSEGRPKFTGLQVLLARKPFATLDDFGGKEAMSFDLTGRLGLGNTPITVQGYGPSGARLAWKVFIQRPTITSVTPNPIRKANQVMVQGRNFSEHAHDMKVLIGHLPAKIVSAKANEIQLRIPSDLSGGTYDLTVDVHSVKSNSIKVSIKIHPQVTFIDFVSTAPGQPLVISGQGFSSNPSENLVLFGSHKADIIDASDSRITCVVPDMHFPQWHVPIYVITNGMRAMEHVTINIDQRVIPNEWIPHL
jgi:hypothetical protein